MTRNESRKLPASRRPNRRGSLYLQVVMVSTLVSLMGLTAISVSRIRRKVYEQGAGSSQARYYAQSAIRMAFQRIKDNPNWRFDNPNGNWVTDIAFADGSYSIVGVDPSDNNLTDDAEDPVVITGIGKHGAAEHRVQVTIVPTRRGMDCLEHAIHSELDLTVHAGELYCNQIASSNDGAKTIGTSHYYCDVETVNGTSGSTFHGATSLSSSRELPSFPGVLSYYLANGTNISPGSLETQYPQVIRNGGFEAGTTEWSGHNCTLEAATGDPQAGLQYLRVTGRADGNAGAEQLITNVISKGKQVDVSVWLRTASASVRQFHIEMVIETDQGTNTIVSGPKALDYTDPWSQLSKTMTPTWTGTLLSIKLRVASNVADTADYFLDGFTLRQQGSDMCMVGKLLSPTSNPYGATNPQGIYILDMANQKVVINYSRIYGTLVLINPMVGSTIGEGGTVVMEPAIKGMPALICSEKELVIKSIDVPLVESQWQTNFNPVGAPYGGVTNATNTDTYLGEIHGMVLSELKVLFEDCDTVVNGSIYSTTDKFELLNGELTVNYDPISYLSPPPGFISGNETIRILLNSAKRPVD